MPLRFIASSTLASLALGCVMLLGPQPALAADTGGQGCADLQAGDVNPPEWSAHLGEQATFYLCGGSASDIDVDTCEWWLEDTEVDGTVAPTTGSPVTWTAPDELEECIPTTFRLFARCAQPATTSWSEITLQCDDDDKSDVRDRASGTEISGGGCNSPTSTGMGLLLLPLLGLGRRRAR